jgi:hypothetical protein
MKIHTTVSCGNMIYIRTEQNRTRQHYLMGCTKENCVVTFIKCHRMARYLRGNNKEVAVLGSATN